MGINPSSEDLIKKAQMSDLDAETKENILKIISGERLANLYDDAIAKRAFSPDVHPERLDFLLQRTMGESYGAVEKSASNEGMTISKYSKAIVTDVPAWLRDGKRLDVEFQAVAQDYIFNRVDIYASNMLMIQFSVEEGQSRKDVDYGNVKGVIVIVLMVKSPKVFREFKSDRYIHRVKKIVTDTGMEFPALKQMAFVQLDKALELFLSDRYNKDEDIGLLKLLAMIADINNDKVKEMTQGDEMYDDIRKEVDAFSKDKEVQAMLLEEEMARADWVTGINAARREGHAEGHAEGRAEGRAEEHLEVQNVYAWLTGQKRIDDISKAATDEKYYSKMLAEYKKANEIVDEE
ncbi:PD-(D/E)XK nuclease family transposase [Butyrivibrio sp. AC2005]|uniref:PD-(D/E)XK nuclease family transposase n=1 Tax=Butyrivibrio sp. AC2005 TaxID=1280672 RepID=UPI0003F98CD6|nr:PD-(D/E)XK nuclease family transposase [Butyrivibrio sp. AC2005]